MDLFGEEGEDPEVSLDEEEAPEVESAPYDDQSPNLVADFKATEEGQKFLRKCADQVIDDFDTAWEGSEEYRAKIADNYKMYAGFLPKKVFPFENCLARDTEILTQSGWKRIDRVKVGEVVMTRRDANGALEWQSVEATPSRYAETLLHFKSNSVDLAVTDDHEMVVTSAGTGRTRRMSAARLFQTTGWKIPLTGAFNNDAGEETIFGLDSGDVAEFVGWWVAEGWYNREGDYKGTLFIGQSREANPEKCDRIEALMDRLGFKWSAMTANKGYTVHISSMPSALVDMLHAQEGGAYEKRVPPIFFQSEEIAGRMLDALVLGDGTEGDYPAFGKTSHRRWFFTSSAGLADDVQILALMTGCRGRVTKLTVAGDPVQMPSGGHTQRDIYRVAILDRKFAKVDRAKKERIKYGDTAFCVTVKNHCIYVRRDGIASFVGNCSNAHVPIMLEGISRLSARTYAEIFGVDDHIFGVQPTGPNDDKIAEILTVHGNWQIRNQLTDFFRQMHRGIVIFFTNGDVTCHSTYDSRTRRNRHEILTTDEFVIPYVMTTTEPDYSDCPFKCRVLYLTKLDLEGMKGEWDEEAIEGVLDGSAPDYDGEPESPLRQAVADVSGILAPDKDDNSEYKLIYYEGSMKLPGDEEARAICATVCPNTRHVLRLYVREENDWRDQIRYDREVQQGQDYEMAMQAHAQLTAKEDALRAQLAEPHIDPMEADMIHQALAQDAMPPPVPPKWYEQGAPTPPRRVPIEMFSHGVCMENFLGSLGLSYGQILADQNRAANNSLNQAIDQATLGNVGTYLMPDLLEIEPGPFEIAPGVINRISGVSGTDIKNAIVELKPSAANPQLFEFVDKMVEYSQSSIAAPDILSGESGKSGETWRGQNARTEQALKQLSVAGGKYAKFTEQIFKCNAKLNSMYLPDEEIVFVASHLIGVGGGQIGRAHV